MSQVSAVLSCSGPVLQQTRTDSSWMSWRKPGFWEELLSLGRRPPEEKERKLQLMFVWSEVDGGSECCGETPAARLTEVRRVPTQPAAPALASSWVAPSLKQNRVHRVTRGSNEGEGEERQLDVCKDTPTFTLLISSTDPRAAVFTMYIFVTLSHTPQGSTVPVRSITYIHTCISQWRCYKSGFVMWPSWKGLI